MCVNTCKAGSCPALTSNAVCSLNNVCTGNLCCPGPVVKCKSSSDCGSNVSNPYCVDGFCSCEKGSLFNTCFADTDCQSGFCTGYNDVSGKHVCGYSRRDCIYSSYTDDQLKAGSKNGYCPSNDKRFCVNGTCSATVTESYCGPEQAVGKESLCTSFTTVAGTIVTSGQSFCVNNYCANQPGWIGDTCNSTYDCNYLEGGVNNIQSNLVCTNNVCTNTSST